VGALQFTVTLALPAIAMTLLGTPGAVAGTTEFDGVEGDDVPFKLVAVTVKL
jgi:hypothetical protein